MIKRKITPKARQMTKLRYSEIEPYETPLKKSKKGDKWSKVRLDPIFVNYYFSRHFSWQNVKNEKKNHPKRTSDDLVTPSRNLTQSNTFENEQKIEKGVQ